MSKKLVLTLPDPFDFEDEKGIKELDLSGITTLTAMDMCQVYDKMLEKGYSGQMMELSVPYVLLITTKALGKPWEYLNKMSARDTIMLKNFVTNFLYTRGSMEALNQEES